MTIRSLWNCHMVTATTQQAYMRQQTAANVHSGTCVASARLLDFLRMKKTSSTMLLVRLPGTYARDGHSAAQHTVGMWSTRVTDDLHGCEPLVAAYEMLCVLLMKCLPARSTWMS